MPKESGVPYLRVRGAMPGGRFKIANVHVPAQDSDFCPELLMNRNMDKSIANANLIAAAPELLGALKGLMSIKVRPSDLTPEHLDCITKAKTAIAKAEGRGS
jgi:hypothetical protein